MLKLIPIPLIVDSDVRDSCCHDNQALVKLKCRLAHYLRSERVLKKKAVFQADISRSSVWVKTCVVHLVHVLVEVGPLFA